MIRVTVEVVPFGLEDEAYTVGTMLIANDGTGNQHYGNYSFAYDANSRPGVLARGVVKDHARSLGFWPLIKRVLNVTSDEKNETTDILVGRLQEV